MSCLRRFSPGTSISFVKEEIRSCWLRWELAVLVLCQGRNLGLRGRGWTER